MDFNKIIRDHYLAERLVLEPLALSWGRSVRPVAQTGLTGLPRTDPIASGLDVNLSTSKANHSCGLISF